MSHGKNVYNPDGYALSDSKVNFFDSICRSQKLEFFLFKYYLKFILNSNFNMKILV